MGPRLHERERLVAAAEADLQLAVTRVWREHELSDAEMLRVVATVLGGHIQGHAKYAIRRERHGNTDKPGGLE